MATAKKATKSTKTTKAKTPARRPVTKAKAKAPSRTKAAPRDFVKLVRLGGEAQDLPFEEGSTVAAFLEAADEPLEGHGLFVNGEEATDDHVLQPGDMVTLAPGVKLG